MVMSNQEQDQGNKNMIEKDQGNKNMIEKGQGNENMIEQDQSNKNMREQYQGKRSIIIVRKDEKDWIYPKTGAPYAGFEMGDINMITLKNILKFQSSLIVLDDRCDKFDSQIEFYFTEGKNKNIRIIVICHKPAQIDNMARMNCDTIYITTYNGADLFNKFNTTSKCDLDFHGITQELNSSYHN